MCYIALLQENIMWLQYSFYTKQWIYEISSATGWTQNIHLREQGLNPTVCKAKSQIPDP